jgi:hypothetical protein
MSAYPLIVNVGKVLFQICPAFVAFLYRVLSERQGRNGYQGYYKKHTNVSHYESPPEIDEV